MELVLLTVMAAPPLVLAAPPLMLEPESGGLIGSNTNVYKTVLQVLVALVEDWPLRGTFCMTRLMLVAATVFPGRNVISVYHPRDLLLYTTKLDEYGTLLSYRLVIVNFCDLI